MNTEERNEIINDFINARLEFYKGHKFEKGYKNRMSELKKFIDTLDNFCDDDSYCNLNGPNNFKRLTYSDYANKVRRNVQEGSRRIDPLVIDLDGDGIKLVNNKSIKCHV